MAASIKCGERPFKGGSGGALPPQPKFFEKTKKKKMFFGIHLFKSTFLVVVIVVRLCPSDFALLKDFCLDVQENFPNPEGGVHLMADP